MDFDQLMSDLSGLTRMAEASQERLAKVTGRVTDLRDQLQRLVSDAEVDGPPDESPEHRPDDA